MTPQTDKLSWDVLKQFAVLMVAVQTLFLVPGVIVLSYYIDHETDTKIEVSEDKEHKVNNIIKGEIIKWHPESYPFLYPTRGDVVNK